MLKFRCSGCGKALAAGTTGQLCSLCSLGFSPARSVDLDAQFQTGLTVNTHGDTGMNCPRCHGKLSYADVAAERCSFCHATVAEKQIPHQPARRRPAKPEPHTPLRIWPDKAPTR